MEVEKLADLMVMNQKNNFTYEATAPKHHWSEFYAAYIAAREGGRTPEEADGDARIYMEGVLRGQGTRE